MHLADGTLANQVYIATAAVSAGSVGYATRRAFATATRAEWLRAGIGAAVVFGVQAVDVPMFNAIPVHMIGAAFLVALAGPALALLALTAVLVVQALVLHDGGAAALGANVFNMGVVAVVVAAAFLRAVRSDREGRGWLVTGAALGAAASVAAAIVAMALELVVSGAPRSVFAAAMRAHAPFVAFETVATAAVVALLANAGAFAGTTAFEPSEK